MAAERLAHNIEAARERRIAKGLVRLTRVGPRESSRLTLSPDWQAPPAPSPAPQRSPRSLHWTAAWVPSPLARRSKLTAPDFDRLARLPWPVASLASSGIRALSSAFARSWSRKAERVAHKRPA